MDDEKLKSDLETIEWTCRSMIEMDWYTSPVLLSLSADWMNQETGRAILQSASGEVSLSSVERQFLYEAALYTRKMAKTSLLIIERFRFLLDDNDINTKLARMMLKWVCEIWAEPQMDRAGRQSDSGITEMAGRMRTEPEPVESWGGLIPWPWSGTVIERAD